MQKVQAVSTRALFDISRNFLNISSTETSLNFYRSFLGKAFSSIKVRPYLNFGHCATVLLPDLSNDGQTINESSLKKLLHAISMVACCVIRVDSNLAKFLVFFRWLGKKLY